MECGYDCLWAAKIYLSGCALPAMTLSLHIYFYLLVHSCVFLMTGYMCYRHVSSEANLELPIHNQMYVKHDISKINPYASIHNV